MLAAAEGYATTMEFFMNRNNLEVGPERNSLEGDSRVVSLELVRVVLSGGRLLDSDAWQVDNMSPHHLSIFLRNHRMCIVAYAYEPGDDMMCSAVMELPADAWSLPPHAILVNPVSPSVPYDIMEAATTRLQRTEGAGPDPARNSLVISVARSTLRELGRNLRHLQQPVRYQFVVATRSLTGAVVEMSRSNLVDLTAPEPVRGAFGGVYVESESGHGGFDVRRIQGPGGDTTALESVLWSMPEADFLDFALQCILRAQDRRVQLPIPGTVSQAALEVD